MTSLSKTESLFFFSVVLGLGTKHKYNPVLRQNKISNIAVLLNNFMLFCTNFIYLHTISVFIWYAQSLVIGINFIAERLFHQTLDKPKRKVTHHRSSSSSSSYSVDFLPYNTRISVITPFPLPPKNLYFVSGYLLKYKTFLRPAKASNNC